MNEPIKIYKANIPLKNFYRAYTGLSTTDTQQIMNVAKSLKKEGLLNPFISIFENNFYLLIRGAARFFALRIIYKKSVDFEVPTIIFSREKLPFTEISSLKEAYNLCNNQTGFKGDFKSYSQFKKSIRRTFLRGFKKTPYYKDLL